jgi:hypothetical protein
MQKFHMTSNSPNERGSIKSAALLVMDGNGYCKISKESVSN